MYFDSSADGVLEQQEILEALEVGRWGSPSYRIGNNGTMLLFVS